MKKRKKRARYTAWMALVLALVLFAGMGIKKKALSSEYDSMLTKQSQLEDKVETLKKDKEDIEEYKSYLKTDKYIEDMAREKLGLVYPNEIIFKAEK